MTQKKGMDKFVSKLIKKGAQDCQIYSNISDLLVGVSQNKPDFIVISANYPHKNICQFPAVLKGETGCGVLFGGEKSDYNTTKLIRSSKCDYKVLGKLTPHNIWAKQVSYQKSLVKEEKAKTKRKSMGSSNGGERIKLVEDTQTPKLVLTVVSETKGKIKK